MMDTEEKQNETKSPAEAKKQDKNYKESRVSIWTFKTKQKKSSLLLSEPLDHMTRRCHEVTCTDNSALTHTHTEHIFTRFFKFPHLQCS